MRSGLLHQPFGLVHCQRYRVLCVRPCLKIPQRSFISKAPPRQKVPDFGFAFDIDGVLLRSAKPLPHATSTLQALQRQHIPFILLTNGGGMYETDRIEQLNQRLGVNLDPSAIIQSHTPFAQLVEGKKGEEGLEDKCVLVVGGPEDKCRQVAKLYGFKHVVTPGDIFMSHPSIWPFSSGFSEYYKRCTQPVEKRTQQLPPGPHGLKFDAILVFNDPRDWALDIQIITDLLLSFEGILGTQSKKNGSELLPNCGYQQDGQPPLYISNPDLVWASSYHLSRLGQGGFLAALEGVWAALTGGATLHKTVIGKPHQATYEFAEKRLVQQREAMYGKDNLPPLRNVYMIGDNPESDIRGANNYKSEIGAQWNSILLTSGVFQGGEPRWTPHVIHGNVKDAVEWSFSSSGWKLKDDSNKE